MVKYSVWLEGNAGKTFFWEGNYLKIMLDFDTMKFIGVVKHRNDFYLFKMDIYSNSKFRPKLV